MTLDSCLSQRAIPYERRRRWWWCCLLLPLLLLLLFVVVMVSHLRLVVVASRERVTGRGLGCRAAPCRAAPYRARVVHPLSSPEVAINPGTLKHGGFVGEHDPRRG